MRAMQFFNEKRFSSYSLAYLTSSTRINPALPCPATGGDDQGAVAREKRIARSAADADNAPAMEILKPTRTEWGSFPDVLIHADESVVKQHADYVAAKAGDVAAAKQLVADVLNPNTTVRIRDALGGSRPFITPVFAEEQTGINRIPAVFAEVLGEPPNSPHQLKRFTG